MAVYVPFATTGARGLESGSLREPIAVAGWNIRRQHHGSDIGDACHRRRFGEMVGIAALGRTSADLTRTINGALGTKVNPSSLLKAA
jgi:hypothetical protein